MTVVDKRGRAMIGQLGRRGFLGGAVVSLGATLGVRGALAAPLPHEDFSFLFVTDTHLEPELNATAGCASAFAKARAIGGDFVIQGGDHIFDALGVSRGRAQMLLDLYDRTQQDLALPIRNVIGNHDCLGIYPKSGVSPSDPLYGKAFYQDHFGPLYYAFSHRGVRFVVLDSIGITADRNYEGRIDDVQLAWLARTLDAIPPGTPIVLVSHIPLVTAFDCYAPPPPVAETHHKNSVVNAYAVLALLSGHNVLGVLQGHTHINETILWRGIPFVTGGAVSGNWWHGTHLGTPEGFTVVSIAGNRMTTRYESYGFHSVDPHNT
jgi:Icc protein